MALLFFPIGGGFSSFSFGGDVIRFATPQCLRRYIRVKKWDDGYIEVDADYGHGAEMFAKRSERSAMGYFGN